MNFGMDGAEHKIRNLTSQLNGKDAELASTRNELIKCKEALAEERKAKQGLQYQLDQDLMGRESSDKGTVALKLELANVRQNLANRDLALASANDTIKKLEKEKQGLEYELECAGSNSDQSSRKVIEQKQKLESEVKALREELRRKEVEETRAKAASAKLSADNLPPPSKIPRMKNSTSSSNFFGAAPTPSPAPSKILSSSSSHRRSISLSHNRETELLGKINTLEEQRKALQVKLHKEENQKLALERSGKKQVEEIQGKLDDANDELEFYRSQGGSGPNNTAELDKVKKERDGLRVKVEALTKELDGARAELESVQRDLNDAGRRLDAAQAASVPVPSATVDNAEVDRLNQRISHLESELSAKSGSADPIDDSQILTEMRSEIRTLKRDLALSKHLVKEAESERDQLDAEVLDLKMAMQKAQARVGGGDELASLKEKLAISESNAAALQASIEAMKAAHDLALAAAADAEKELSRQHELAQTDLAATRTQLDSANARAEEQQRYAAGLKSSLDSRDEIHESAIREIQDKLSLKNKEVEAAQAALAAAEAASAETAEAISRLRAQVAEAERSAEQAREAQQELVCAGETMDQLQKDLAELETSKSELSALEFGARQERDQARRERDQVGDELAALKADLETIKASAETATDDAAHSRATICALQGELEDAKKRLANRLLEIEEFSDKLQTAATDIAKLEQRNGELEDTLANRSTESESQHRQEEIFQLKDDLQSLQAEYASKDAAFQANMAQLTTFTSRVQELENLLLASQAKANAAAPESVHAHLMQAKIEKLRSERDELLQTMSFVRHESRFAIQAAEADATSIKDQLERVTNAMQEKGVEAEKSQVELAQLRGHVAELGTELATLREQANDELQKQLEIVKADRDSLHTRSTDISKQYGELVTRHTDLGNSLDALRQQYALAQSQAARAERERVIAVQQLDEHRDKMDGVAVSEDGTTLAESTRSRKHSKRSSLQMFSDHAAMEQARRVEMLDSRLKEEKERVQRRNVAIEKLQRERTQAEGREKLAQEGVREKDEAIEAIQEEKNALQVDLDGWKLKLAERSEELAAALAEREAIDQRLHSLRADREADRADMARFESDLHLARSNLVAAENELAVAASARKDLGVQLEQMRRHAADSDLISGKHVAELQAELETLRIRHAAIEAEREAIAGRATTEAESSRVEIERLYMERHELQKQVAKLEQHIHVVENQRDALSKDQSVLEEEHAVELDALRGQVADLTTRLEDATKAGDIKSEEAAGRIVQLEAVSTELDIVRRKLVEATDRLAEANRSLEARDAESLSQVQKLQAATDEAVSRSQSAEAELNVARSKVEETQRESEARLADLQSTVASETARLQREHEVSTDQLQKEVLAARAELDAKVGEQEKTKAEMESRVNVMLARAKAAEADVLLQKAKVSESAAQLQVAIDTQNRSLGERSALEAQISEANNAVSTLTERVTDLEAQLSVASASAVDSSALDEMRSKVEGLEQLLQQKINEYDEADDRVREISKELVKAQKSKAKSDRRLAALEKEKQDLETAANTALNTKLMLPTADDMAPALAPSPRLTAPTPATSTRQPFTGPAAITREMAPPPIPSARANQTAPTLSTSFAIAPTPSPAPGSRAPLRSVNVFDKSQIPASFATPVSTSGLKRCREGDGADAKLPAEAIMQPIAPLSTKRAAGPLSAMRPIESKENQHQRERSEPRSLPRRNNIFAEGMP